MKKMQKDKELLEEYYVSGCKIGKYSQKYNSGTNVIVIEPDVAKYYPDNKTVNQALRLLVEIIKKQKKFA